MNTAVGRGVPVALYLAMILVPLVLALERLMFVTGMNPIQAILHLDEHPFGVDAVVFTFVQAILSATLTLMLGLRLHGGWDDTNGNVWGLSEQRLHYRSLHQPS